MPIAHIDGRMFAIARRNDAPSVNITSSMRFRLQFLANGVTNSAGDSARRRLLSLRPAVSPTRVEMMIPFLFEQALSLGVEQSHWRSAMQERIRKLPASNRPAVRIEREHGVGACDKHRVPLPVKCELPRHGALGLQRNLAGRGGQLRASHKQGRNILFRDRRFARSSVGSVVAPGDHSLPGAWQSRKHRTGKPSLSPHAESLT